MFSQEELNAAWANAKAPAKKKQPKKQKGFLLDQISTGGGIGGALAGGSAGAAIGSVVPGVGTAIGGIIGALLGGSAGSAAGEFGENAIMGEKDLGKNVGKEALIGGVTSLPIGAGLKLAQAGIKAGTGIGKTGARELVEQAGAKVVPGKVTTTAAMNGRTQRAGKNLEKLSGQMLNSQTQITGAQARRLGLNPVKTMAAVNQRTGLTNLDDMAEVSRNLTGGQGSILDALTREAVGNTNGVKLGNLRETATDLIDKHGKLLSENERKKILRQVENSIYGGRKGSLSPLSDPHELLDQANSFRSAARSIEKAGLTATPEQAQQARIYNGLAQNIEEALYKSPGISDALPTLTKYGATSLREMAGEARAAGSKAHADAYMKIADELSNVKNVKELRRMKKDFVDVGKMDNLTAQADGARQFNAESASSMMKGSPIKGTVAALTNMATPRVAGQVGKAGLALQRGGSQASMRVTQSIPMLTARQAGGRLLTAPSGTQDASLNGLDQQLPTDSQFTDAQMPMEEPSIGGVTKSQLEQAMMAAAADGNEDALSQLKAMYDLLPQGAELSSSNAQKVAQSANGEATLNQLEGLLQNAGGAQGPILGAIRGANPFDTNARTYDQLSQGSVAQIAKALGETGALSDTDIRVYKSMLPTLSDTPDVAKAKIAALKQRLAVARQNTLLYGAGAQEQFGANN